MGAREFDASLRVLARHQWVRERGTLRVTTLAGPLAATRAVWLDWLRQTGRTPDERFIFAPSAPDGPDGLGAAAARALALATSAPLAPIAILVDPESLAAWLSARGDRLAVFIAEGVVELDGGPDDAAPTTIAAAPPASVRAGAVWSATARARSQPERRMFEALEATPSTTGQFQLNQHLSFHFGGRAIEVDLLARSHDLAVEIDGYHHFTDLDHYRRDRDKDLLLQAHGYVVLRFLADDVVADPAPLVQSIVAFLGIRAGARPRKRG